MARLVERLGLTRFDADENYKLALTAYDKRNLDEAILKMNAAIELLSSEPEYYATRGFFYLEDGVRDKAQADFEAALKLNPYEMLAHYGRGIIAFQDRNWDEAVAHFMDAYYADPQRPETLYYLALAHHRRRDNKTALPIMEQAQQRFEEAKDRRRIDAGKWIREFQKLIEQQEKAQDEVEDQQLAQPKTQAQLPLGDQSSS